MTMGNVVALIPRLVEMPPSLSEAYRPALSKATSLQSLCVRLKAPTNTMLAAIAGLPSLTRLHLTLPATQTTRPVHLSPLAQLTCLEDFALQCLDSSTGNSCAHVLCSSSNTLQTVQLGIFGMDGVTCLALYSLSKLQALMLQVNSLDTSLARRITRLTASTIHVWVCKGRRVRPEALRVLGMGQSITHLTLEHFSERCMQHMVPMQGLRTLTILASPDLTGEKLCFQPNLHCLSLVHCRSLTVRGTQDAEKSFPGVQILCVWAYHARSTLYLSQRALDVAATSQRHAQVISLRGVDNVNKASMETLGTRCLDWLSCDVNDGQSGPAGLFNLIYVADQPIGGFTPILWPADHEFKPSSHMRPKFSCFGEAIF